MAAHRLAILLFPAAILLGSLRARAVTQIWSSGANDLTFTLDSSSPAPDQITPNVAITRNGSQGIYNALAEFSYSHDSSPEGTQWAFSDIGPAPNPTFAYGQGANQYSNLTFNDWETALGGSGALQSNILNRPAVLHITAAPYDIYIDLEFTAWGSHGAGNFTYTRAVGSLPLPGDTNGDGVINIDDYLAIDFGYLHHLSGPANGDFNGDGTIDALDYAIIDSSFSPPPGPAAIAAGSPVPEPASLAILALAFLPHLRRRV